MSTSLDDLPRNEGKNIVLDINEKPVQSSVQESNNSTVYNPNININNEKQEGPQLSPDDINKIISGIQNANKNDLTKLPSKNIPMDQGTVQSDPQAKPNYLPGENKGDYINNSMNMNDVIKQHKINKIVEERNDDIYNKLQLPLLLFILSFIFQLPFVNKILYKYIPGLFVSDGNVSFGGYVFKSLIFTSIIYIIHSNIDYIIG